MKLSSVNTRNFSILSKDKNQIHLSKKFSRNFFFKEPVVHGVDLAIRALKKFLDKRGKSVFIEHISFKFKNFLQVNEDFKIKIFTNKIYVVSKINTKLEIYLKYKKIKKRKIFKSYSKYEKFYNIKNLINADIINELVFISYYVGSVKPGNGSLIHEINISSKEQKNSKVEIKKKINNIFLINYRKKNLLIEVLTSKLLPFKKYNKKIKFSSQSLNNLKGKRILIFGISSDLGQRLSLNLQKFSKIYKHSFRLDINESKIKFKEIKNLISKIQKIKPDYIFYFSAPNIYYGERNNKKLLNYYNLIFVEYFKILLDIIYKNKIFPKVFYPSTIFLNNKKKYQRYECYLISKLQGEKICRTYINNRNIKYFRIPKIKTRSNYNFLGFYEGENINVVDKCFDNFFKN